MSYRSTTTATGLAGDGSGANPIRPDFDALPGSAEVGSNIRLVISSTAQPNGALLNTLAGLVSADGGNALSLGADGGLFASVGGGTPGLPVQAVQFNTGPGTFAGNAGFTYNPGADPEAQITQLSHTHEALRIVSIDNVEPDFPLARFRTADGTGMVTITPSANQWTQETNNMVLVRNTSDGGSLRQASIGIVDTVTTNQPFLTVQSNVGDEILLQANGSATSGATLDAMPRSMVLRAAAQQGLYVIASDVAATANIVFATRGTAAANERLRITTLVEADTSIVSRTAGANSLGSATQPFSTLHLAGASGTPGTNNFTLTGTATAPRTITMPDLSGTLALTANNLGIFAATTSAQLAGVISDETGSGPLVFATSPMLTTPVINVGSDAIGDIYYRNAGGLFTRLAVGSAGQVLTVSGGLPAWAAPSAGASWSALTNPSGNLSLSMAANTSTFTYSNTTGANDLFSLTTGSNDIGSGYVLSLSTPGASNAKKAFGVMARGALAFEITTTGAVNAPGTDGSGLRIGSGAVALTGGVAYGTNANASGNSVTALGASASATGIGGTVVGAFASDGGANRATIIGRGTNAGGFSNVLILGYSVTSTANNQVIIGTDAGVDSLFIGQGPVSTTAPANVTIQPTGGFSTNSVASNLILAAGISTGNAAPASLIFKTTAVGSSGGTPQTLSERARINSAGLGVGLTPTVPLHVKADAGNNGLQVNSNSGAINVAVSADGSGALIGTITNHPVDILSNGATRIRIEAGGGVGINDAAPGAQLEVTANAAGAKAFIANSSASPTVAIAEVHNNTAPVWSLWGAPWQVQTEATTDPTSSQLSAGDQFAIYKKNDKFVIAYNNAGTITYLTIPLDGATTTWTQSTTAP